MPRRMDKYVDADDVTYSRMGLRRDFMRRFDSLCTSEKQKVFKIAFSDGEGRSCNSSNQIICVAFF